MEDWARKEIELACKKENPDWDGKTFDYGCSCYQSALKAFKSLLEDNHSGFSIMVTKRILNRLIEGKCLTAIEDTEDVWNSVELGREYNCYQCKRQGSLFKDVYPDGTVKYHDINRVVAFDVDDTVGYHNSLISNLIDELYPIEMPYFPVDKPYKVYTETFLVNPKNGYYDTRAILYLITPNGERVEVNRYYAEKDGEMVGISKEEYEERKRGRES